MFLRANYRACVTPRVIYFVKANDKNIDYELFKKKKKKLKRKADKKDDTKTVLVKINSYVSLTHNSLIRKLYPIRQTRNIKKFETYKTQPNEKINYAYDI